LSNVTLNTSKQPCY